MSGEDSIRFDGNRVLSSTRLVQLFQTSSSGLTVVAVTKADNVICRDGASLSSCSKYILNFGSADGAANNSNFEVGYAIPPTFTSADFPRGDGTFGIHRGNLHATLTPAGTAIAGVVQKFIVTVNSTGTTASNILFSVNGTSVASVKNVDGWFSAGSYSTKFAPLEVGARIDGNHQAATTIQHSLGLLGSPFVGEIAELMIWNRPLTAAEITTINNYLSSRYGQ